MAEFELPDDIKIQWLTAGVRDVEPRAPTPEELADRPTLWFPTELTKSPEFTWVQDDTPRRHPKWGRRPYCPHRLG